MKGFPGCFRNYRYFEEKLGKNFFDKYKALQPLFQRRNKALQESFNYIDGRRTIADIFEAVQAELWSSGYPASLSYYASFEEMTNYFQLLKDAGVIEFRNWRARSVDA